MTFLVLMINGHNMHYVAVETEYSNIFRYSFCYSYEEDVKKASKMEIRECNFDLDKRGGLKLILLNKTYNIKEIPKEKTHILSNVEKFIPINVFWHEEGMVKLSHFDYAIKDILENEYLKYKNKYVLLNGVVQKVKYSHYIIEDTYFLHYIYEIIQEYGGSNMEFKNKKYDIYQEEYRK